MPDVRVKWKLDLDEAKVRRHFEEHGDAAAEEVAEHIGSTADETAPRDDGTLIRSRRVVRVGNGHYVVSYNTEYAVFQHEAMDWQHDPGRRAKWLERTLAEQRQESREIARQELKL